MSAIEAHTALMFGYFLGGPKDGWSGLASEKVEYHSEGWGSWVMPKVSYADEAMRDEDHPDHFQGLAEERLEVSRREVDGLWQYANAEGVFIAVLGDEHTGWSVLVCAKVIAVEGHAKRIGSDDLRVYSSHYTALSRAMEKLELKAAEVTPGWHITTWEA